MTKVLIWKIIIGFIFFGIITSCKNKTEIPKAKEGIIHLQNWDFQKNGIIDLDGEWKFYWKLFLTYKNFQDQNQKLKPKLIKVPMTWEQESMNDKKIPGHGYATYKLTVFLNNEIDEKMAFYIDDFSTAFKLYVNEDIVAYDGIVGNSPETMKPRTKPNIYFVSLHGKRIDIIVHVSNFYNYKGGFWHSLKLGTAKQIVKYRDRSLISEFFLMGSLFIMGMYSIVIFIVLKRDKSPMYFGLFCLIVGLRALVTNQKYLLEFFPNTPWEVYMKIEYMSWYLAVPVFANYAYSLFKEEFHKIGLWTIWATGCLFSAFVLFTPSRIYSYSSEFYQIATISSITYFIYVLSQALYHKKESSKLFLFAFLILVISIINDILYAKFIISTFYSLSSGFFIFLFVQSLLLAKRFAKAFIDVDNLSKELKYFNETLEEKIKFRTDELQTLSVKLSKYLSPQVYESIFTGKKDVKIETTRKKLTVFFSDIKGFSEITDSIEPESLASVLNEYLNEMTNIAIKHGGTIDKFIGDAIMIFFGDPETKGEKEDATNCVLMAIEMREKMRLLQKKWADVGVYKPFKIRIGINTGYCTVGNFGSSERLDYTIIGQQVNLASRLESNAQPDQILISYDTYALIKENIFCEKKEEIKVKGISHPVQTYQVVNISEKRKAINKYRDSKEGIKIIIDLNKIDKDSAIHTLEKIIDNIKISK